MSSSVSIKTEEEVILENAEYNSAEELEEELHLQLDDSGGESYHIQYHSEPSTTLVSSQGNRQRGSSNMNSSGGGSPNGKNADGSKNLMENEKRMRREIANSNERRRMQSINAGFQNLRALLPQQEGEKLSKAAILQQTSQYICELENQKTQLLAQNSQLKRQLGQHESSSAGSDSGHTANESSGVTTEPISGVAIKKRKLAESIINIQTISDSSDEGLGSMSPEPMTLLNANANANSTVVTKSQLNGTIIAHTAKELSEVKRQLEKERRVRSMLEDELSAIKRQLYSVATAPTTAPFITREVIDHTDNVMRDNLEELPPGSVSYVEIDENGQQKVVVCSSIEELENEDEAAANDIITEDAIQEEVILSSTSSTESETEVSVTVNDIAKAYAEGKCPNIVNGSSTTVLQPILQAAIKATPKVEVERINETVMKVKMEKIDQPIGLTRSRQNLETIVEAIRHLEGDHLFGEVPEHKQNSSQDAPLALTTKQAAQAQRTTLAELRPFLQLKGNKQLTIVGGSGSSLTLTTQQLVAAASKVQSLKDTAGHSSSAIVTNVSTTSAASRNNRNQTTAQVTPTALYKVQTSSGTSSSSTANDGPQQITITTSALKQCRPGVIVAKQHS